METTTTMSCCWASQLLCLCKLPARAAQQIPSFDSNVWCILFKSYPCHESLECCKCCHMQAGKLEGYSTHFGQPPLCFFFSTAEHKRHLCHFPNGKAPFGGSFQHPPAFLSFPRFPCSHNSAGQKVTQSSAAPGAIYSHSGRARSSYSTKELLISNFHPTQERRQSAE